VILHIVEQRYILKKKSSGVLVEIISRRITQQELIERYCAHFPGMTKVVVDIARRIMAVDAEWHADLEIMLLEDGSVQQDLWGANLLLLAPEKDFIVYESLINIRPSMKNFSMTVSDPEICNAIKYVIDLLVDYGQASCLEEPAPAYNAGNSGRSAIDNYKVEFRHHKTLTMEKWLSFPQYKRVLMAANEIGRAGASIQNQNRLYIRDSYERALELLQITIDAAYIENAPEQFIHALLRLREQVGRLYAGKALDADANSLLYDQCIALDPQAWEMLHPKESGLEK
jgi:hypothetical protein